MIRRLFTPAIVLASFAATFAVLSWRAGVGHDGRLDAVAVAPVPVPAQVSAQRAPSEVRASLAPLPAPAPEPAVVPAVTADPPPDVQPEPTAPATDEFLDAQDRAARHSSRSH